MKLRQLLILCAVAAVGIFAASRQPFPQFLTPRTTGNALRADSAIDLQFSTGTEARLVTFFAQGPNSGTYTDTVRVWAAFDGLTWDGTPITMVVSNTNPDTSVTVWTQTSFWGVSSSTSGTITGSGSSNGRLGVTVGVNR